MRVLSSLILLIFLVSCSLQSKLTVLPSGSLGVEASMRLKPQTREAWKNLRDLDSTLPADPFDPILWRQGLGPGAKIAATDTGTSVAFVIANPKKLFPTLTSDASTWDLTLDRTSVRRIAALSSWGDSPALDSLLPSPETSVTEAEYKDLLVYLLGPGTTVPAAKTLIDASVVELTIVTPKPILTAEGAVSVSGNQAVYRWPVVRLLTLTTPVHLRLTF